VSRPRPELELQGDRVALRPARAGDAERLAEILAEPAVAAWWPNYDLQRVREELPEFSVAVVDGDVAGWLIVTDEDDPDYRHAAFDIALTSELHGRGYATEALRLVIAQLIDEGHHRFTIDPSAGNERAIRAYAALGFKPVGTLREYERRPDGRGWRDGLLMELLASEFRREPAQARK
jgi:aminoglycoside 6'-N-acetyltransferase